MTNIEILAKAIQKAIDGGWKKPKNGYNIWLPVTSIDPYVILYEDYDSEIQYDYQAVIFNHDFAKSLWGEKDDEAPIYIDPVAPKDMVYFMQKVPIDAVILWQFHLQQMVIADDPIKYLGDNI